MSQRTPPRKLAWRFITGQAMDGRLRTDATLLHGSANTLWPRPVWKWHHLPQLARAGIRDGTVVAGVVSLWGAVAYPVVTLAAWGAALATAAGWGAWWLYRKVRYWRHHRRYVRPLRRALTPLLEGAPPQLAITTDRSEVRVALPPGFIGTDREWEQIDRAVRVKLAIEADRVPQLQGPKPYVLYTKSIPPPSYATWDAHVEAAVEAAAHDVVILGFGCGGSIVSASLSSDSPHVGLNMGSGGGKTNLGSFAGLQFLHRGDICAIIDAKLISYPWARSLPNVCYAGTILEIHDLLVGLGDELQRRNEVSLAGLQPSGAIRANVGPRILLFAEELNFVIPKLKRYWADLRTLDKTLPKRSPALDAIADIAFAGRQVLMHIFFIGQMLTAAATGANDSSVRGNIGIACMARYTPSSWSKMSALPMPEVPTVEGRIQVVTAAGIRATQVPYLRLDTKDAAAEAAAQWARDYAVSGECAVLPSWMPGAVPVGVGHDAPPLFEGPDQPIGVRQDPAVPAVPGAVTLREAAEAGLFKTVEAARKQSQRKGFRKVGQRDGADLYDVAELAGRNGHR